MKYFLILLGILFFNTTIYAQQKNNTLPNVELKTLDGQIVNTSDISNDGKPIVISFWATWCSPCLAEMPDMDKAAKILGDENFIFLAASDEEMEKIQKFAFKNKYSFQFVHSKTSVFDLDIMALPTTMIIDSKGEIVYNEVGARDWSSKKELENLRTLAKK